MVIYKKVCKYYLPVLFFLILSLLLIFPWFKDGYFYGGLDVGLPTYNPQRIFEIAKYIWWESIAPGFLFPHAITSITLYFFLSFFQFLGLGPVGIQAILFFALLFLMGFGMYLLTLSILGQDKKIYATIAGLFYIFNPYMMAQIWHRFIHTSFFFVAAIPFLILFWRLWIRSGNYLYLLYFLLINLLASYMFGTIAFVFPLWLILSLFTLSEIFLPWENKSYFTKVFWRSIFGLVFWILFNSWWLIPVLTISQGIASQVYDIWESISTLIVISQKVILPYSLQMSNSYYFFEKAELGEVYKSFFFRLIPWLGVVTIFCGFIYALRKRHLAFYPLIFLIIIMLSKGSSSPFGQPFLLLFSKFFALGVLRNPFEKIGILLPVVSSILFVIGIEGFFRWSVKKLGNLVSKLILLILFMFMGVYYWPMYQGTVFGTPGQPNYVEIPLSYKQADNWLDDRVNQEYSKADGKILHLPLTRSDVVTYRWEYGYHGIDSSFSLFTALPSISRGANSKNTDDGLTALSLIFQSPYNLHQDKILKLLQDFNVRFIVLHKDMVWKGSDTYDPQETEQVLDNLNFLERKIQYGDLVIYELLPQYFKSKVILTNSINFAFPQTATMRMWPYLIFENSNDSITSLNNDIDKIIAESKEIVVFPQLSFNYLEASEKGLDLVVNNLAVLLYSLTDTKAMLNKDSDIDTERVLTQIISAGEDLINVHIYLKNNDILQVDPLIRQYTQTINELFKQDLRKSKLSFFVSPSTFDDIFKLHLLILDQIEMKLGSDQKQIISFAKNKIKQDLSNYKLLPTYPLAKTDNLTTQERQINQFSIPIKGKYELLMSNRISRDIYPSKLAKLDFQINDKKLSLEANDKGDLISFGKINLDEGTQEISFNRLVSENQFSTFDQLAKVGNVNILDQNTIQLSSDGIQPAFVDSQLTKIEGEESYLVTFDALIQSGTGFYVQIIQDTDPLQGDKPNPLVKVSVYRISQDSNWQTYKVQLPSLNLTTRKAVFRLIVDPAGITSFGDLKDNQPTVVSIKNVQVGRVLDNPIYLYSRSQTQTLIASSAAETTQLKEETPVSYTGKIRIDQPTFMIFKEAFNSGWELELKKDNEVYKVDKHYLANLYSNSWWIKDAGEYNFRIEFKPQQGVNIGFYLAAGGLLGILSLVAGSKIRQKYGKN